MSQKKWIKRFKTWHKWPAIVISLFAFFFAFSGLIMNHRDWFSSVDVSRKILPANYSYRHWNLSALRGSENIGHDSVLVYGNVGIWLSNSSFSSFSDFNAGFPAGIDNRKISSLKKWRTQLVAGSYFGLYTKPLASDLWQKVHLPVENQRISDITIKQDTLLILTRDYLLKTCNLDTFSVHAFSPPPNYERKTGLFNTLWELHSGELFGFLGKLLVDLLGIVTMFLSVSGILHYLYPKFIKRKKKRNKNYQYLLNAKRINIRWHNVLGYLFAAFLIINTTAGMFLRPPLLIPIMNSQVGIIPGTHLDSPNPWHDKLRKIVWDENAQKYLLSTSDGFFHCTATLQNTQAFRIQAPVSIMGCNVLEKQAGGVYLVGSFSGLFVWNPSSGVSRNYFTQAFYKKPEGMARPVSDHMVSGFAQSPTGNVFYFDYKSGAHALKGQEAFGSMSPEVIAKSKISLWNLALEIHTGRIFESIIGLFYMLYVPFAGLCLLLVLISGFLLWYRVYRK